MMQRKAKNAATLPRAWFQACVLASVLFGGLVLLSAALIVNAAWRAKVDDPLSRPQLQAMIAQLEQDPTNTQLQAEVRQLDLRLRQEFFRRQNWAQYGGWLLLPVCGAFLLSIRMALHWRRKLPCPTQRREVSVLEIGRQGRLAVAATCLLLMTAAAIVGIGNRPAALPGATVASTSSGSSTALPPVAPAELASNWHRFRGPGGSGLCTFANIPDGWDGSSGSNILWKSPVPLPGESSPIVWGKKVFLTGADKTSREVYCFDADSGKLLWRKAVGSAAAAGDDEEEPLAGFASPTPCSDGRRVFAIFPTMDLVCLSLDGEEIWKKNLGPIEVHYGYAASLCLAGDKLIVMMDQSTADENKSKMVAFDAATGKLAWEIKRPVDESWSTPVIAEGPSGLKQIITSAKPWVIGYDASSGNELWRADLMAGEVAPSPVVGGGMVYVANEGAGAAAIRMDGSGNVTKTHVTWHVKEDIALPNTASPASDGKLVFLADSMGNITCLDAGDGRKLWEHSFDVEFQGSPTVVGDKLYALANDGVMYFISASRQFELIDEAKLGEGSTCSPAFAEGRIFVRGKRNLFCIGGIE